MATMTATPDLTHVPALTGGYGVDQRAPRMTDEELCAQALAADPDTAVDADAVTFWAAAGIDASAPLPEWYMPTSVGGAARLWGWRRRVAGVTVALVSSSFFAITAAGLCNTYGQIHL